MSDPKPAFDPTKRLTKVKGADYLPVSARIAWFRDDSRNGTIDVEHIVLDPEWAVFRAVVTRVGDGGEVLGRGSGYGAVTRKDFPAGHVEKASTKAIGRALASLGYGTEDVGDDEGEGTGGVIDSPIDFASRNQHRAAQTAQHRPQRTEATRPGPSQRATEATDADAVSAVGIGRLHGEAKKRGITDHAEVHALAVLWCDVRSVKDLTPKQLHGMLAKLTGGDRLDDAALKRDVEHALAVVQTWEGGTAAEAAPPVNDWTTFWDWAKAEGLPHPADKLVRWLGEEIKHLTPQQARELIEARRRDLAALEQQGT